MTRAEIDGLRAEIERIDAQILELVAQREQLANEVGLVKARDGLEVRDKHRERQVKAAFTKRARGMGMDPSFAEILAELLIQHSVKLQLTDKPRDLKGEKALVVGGSGRMGSWFCRRLANRGAKVLVWDARGRLEGYENVDSIEKARECDLTVVASPPGACPEDLEKVLGAGPHGLVFDVCSIKSHIAPLLRKAASDGMAVTTVHPMFGPSVPTARGRNVIICDCGNDDANKAAERLFQVEGANIVRLDITEHDAAMAYVLGLPHLCSMMFATTLAESGRSIASLRALQGPSFQKMAAAARELSKESARVYHGIQCLNPSTKALVTSMAEALDRVGEAAMSSDPKEFKSIMESNRKYLQEA